MRDASGAAVEEIVRRTASRWEGFLAGTRGVFCFLVLVRLVITNVGQSGGVFRLGMEVPVLVGIVLFSVWTIVRTRTAPATEGLLVASVAVDAVGCFLALLTNVVSPDPASVYQGLLRMPDFAGILIAATAVGLRLSPRATLVGAILHTASAGALVASDFMLNGPRLTYHGRDVALVGILLFGALALAAVVSTRARNLAHTGGVKTVAADRAQRNMWEVLQDSHEMRSALSAVALETDLFLRAADKGEDVDRVGKSLREELTALNALVAGVRERTYAELAAMQGAARVDVVPIADEVIARVATRFPRVSLKRTGEGAQVLLAGGRGSIERILSNLLVNACEGNGTAAAENVEIVLANDSITIRDDGPGFSEEILEAPLDARGPTTKKDGSGLGLFLVKSIVTASGGSLTRTNRERGAEVTIRFA